MIRLAAACLAAAAAGTAYAVIRWAIEQNQRAVEHNAVTGTGGVMTIAPIGAGHATQCLRQEEQ